MIDSICIIISKPQGDERALLGILFSWATLMAAAETKVLCIDEGVFNLIESRSESSKLLKKFISEKGDISCPRTSLLERGLKETLLFDGVNLLDEEEVPSLISSCESTAYF